MEDNKLSNFTISLIAGGCAGVFVDIGLFPVDTLKTRIQSGKIIKTNKNNIFKGVTSTLLGSFPSAAAFFASYDFTNQYFTKNYKPKESQLKYVNMIASSIGECVAVLVRNPFELIKQNLQVGNHKSIIQSASHIIKKEGIIGLYRGYYITVFREIPFSIIQFPLYEYIKRKLLASNKTRSALDNNLTLKQSFICGATAGSIAALVTTPLDVVKTRIMTNEKNSKDSKIGIIDTIKEIYSKNKSITAFFAGAKWRIIYISVGGVCFFGTNEKIKRELGYQNYLSHTVNESNSQI